LKAFHLTQEQVESAEDPGFWATHTGLKPGEVNGWLAFVEPYHLDSETWLRTWNQAYPCPVLGGLASGNPAEQSTQVYLNGEVHESGAVVVGFSGEVGIHGVTSQGCTPIGETWTLTRVNENIVQQIGNRPAYQILAETFEKLSPEEQLNARGNLFIGLVVNEYLEEFHRGDFLIRNLLGADPSSGNLAVGALPRQGQTVQFQLRSAAAAKEDMNALLTRARKQLANAPIYGGCLFCCNGRGRGLFGEPHHDASKVTQFFGPMGLTGFFCNGEIGPVGERNFIHGYTASLALFVGKSRK
jgi:small ligand-binding sensory domain FIST